MSEELFDFFMGGLVGLLAWFFGGLDGFFQVLIAFSAIDYITGTFAAWLRGTISSSIGLRGILKKCVIFTFVGIAHLLDQYVMPTGDSGLVRMAVCLFYISNEGISIIENADAIGIPIPNFLKEKLLHLKDSNNDTHEHVQNNHDTAETQLLQQEQTEQHEQEQKNQNESKKSKRVA